MSVARPSPCAAAAAPPRPSQADDETGRDAGSVSRRDLPPLADSRLDLADGLDKLCIDAAERLQTSDSVQHLGDTLKTPLACGQDTLRVPPRVFIEARDRPTTDCLEPSRPFHKWMRSLHRKARQRPSLLGAGTGALPHWFVEPGHDGVRSPRPSIHRKSSSSGSSFKFVSAVRSASASLASVSIVARSKRNTALSHCVSRSSRASISGPRVSEDSAVAERFEAVDAAALERSLQRRRILEELIATEEGYIGDVRFLINAYVTILASLPSLCAGLRSSINRNLTEIIELHEEILGELHRVIPHSEYTQPELPARQATVSAQSPMGPHVHRRWTSCDAAESRGHRSSWLQAVPGMLSEPQVGAEVAKVFAKKMNRFFIYKEYGAKYEMMIKDVGSAHQSMPQWDSYQRGLEVLASILSSAKTAEEKSKKALTIGDLLVKPIQRVCKYPLLFAELLKHTPVSDCPNSHMELEGVLLRLREATAEINRATNDCTMKTTLERTWVLQDRLVFPNRELDAASKNRVRSFGHILLCGALHICWQSPGGVAGRYMICLLYRDVLCLATAGKADQIYIVQACVDLSRARIDDADNGRGLQCHTAPFSWKMIFECNHQLYEMVMTACTPKEEMEWRARLALPARSSVDAKDPALFCSLDLEMKSLGTLFGKPGTMARRVSIHRATTVGPKSPLCQVVLKNTSIVREASNMSSSSLAINRSQSLLTTNARMPVLAPARSERARLEALLADVWSREVLPFPGMTTRARSEHLVRTSASTVMRKLSVASIASSFTKRSASVSQRAKTSEDAGKAETGKRRVWRSSADDGASDDQMVETDTARRVKKARTGQGLGAAAWNQGSGSRAGLEVMETDGLVRGKASRAVGEVGESISLRASSVNSQRLGQNATAHKSTSPVAEKENVCGELSGKEASQGRRRRTGGSKAEGLGHGFMSLFR